MDARSPPGGTEARQHPRVRIDGDVGVQVRKWSGLHGNCVDSSCGGVRLRLPDRVAVGDRLLFEVDVGEGPQVITGEVRRVARTAEGLYEVGLAWVERALGERLFEAMLADARARSADRVAGRHGAAHGRRT